MATTTTTVGSTQPLASASKGRTKTSFKSRGRKGKNRSSTPPTKAVPPPVQRRRTATVDCNFDCDSTVQVHHQAYAFLLSQGCNLIQTSDGEIFKRQANGRYLPMGNKWLRWELKKFNDMPSNQDWMESIRDCYDSNFSTITILGGAVKCFIPVVPFKFIMNGPQPPPKLWLDLLRAGVDPADHGIVQESMGEALLDDSTKPPMFVVGPDGNPMANIFYTVMKDLVADRFLISESNIPKTLKQLEDDFEFGLPVLFSNGAPEDAPAWRSGEKFIQGLYTDGWYDRWDCGGQPEMSSKIIARIDDVNTVAPDLIQHSDVVHVQDLPKEMVADVFYLLREERWAIMEWALTGLRRLHLRDKFSQNLITWTHHRQPSMLMRFLDEIYDISTDDNGRFDRIERFSKELLDRSWRSWADQNGLHHWSRVPLLQVWEAGMDLCDVSDSSGKTEQVYTNDPAVLDRRALELKLQGAKEGKRYDMTDY